jgi:hypothetical protein
MADTSRFKVSMDELEKVHVPTEDLVEEHDVTPPVPALKSDDERVREQVLRTGVPGL